MPLLNVFTAVLIDKQSETELTASIWKRKQSAQTADEKERLFE